MSTPVPSRDSAGSTSPTAVSAAGLWIREADVTSLLPLAEAITTLEQGLEAEARGTAQNMIKTHVIWGDGNSLHALGATFADAGFVGTKTWAHTKTGAAPLLILFDSHSGRLAAVIEAFTLGQLRTGGIAGVATRWLAAADAGELALIGTGKQAQMQVAAVAAVRPLRRVRVFSPNAAHRAALAATLRSGADFTVVDAPSLRDAIAGAPIVTLVTRAREPFLTPDLVARGAHINAMGAITSERMEFSPEVLGRCETVVVDSLPSARTLARELIEYYGAGPGGWDDVTPLCNVVAQRQCRPPGRDLSLFKSMGTGIADLAVGIEIYRRAVARGVGRPLDGIVKPGGDRS